MMLSDVFFFLEFALAFQSLTWLHTNFRIIGSISVRNVHGNVDRDCLESIDCLGWYGHFNHFNYSNYLFPFICALFNVISVSQLSLYRFFASLVKLMYFTVLVILAQLLSILLSF